MRISINTLIKDGPWGGGNRFIQSLTDALKQRGDEVLFNLNHEAIDLILIIDPRRRNPQLSFTISDIIEYQKINPRALVVHRINECDERKNTLTMNIKLRAANLVANHTIFIASWLCFLDVWNRSGEHSVILNGANVIDFPRNSASVWNSRDPLRIVTHHWGANDFKGWDVYKKIDLLLSDYSWRKKFEFTFIGNRPKNIFTENIREVAPLNGKALSDELASHHVYITASQNEPAGMHHIEGAIIGLPLLYRNSGALPEYCGGFGEIFDGPDDISLAVDRMLSNYSIWKYKMLGYNNTADRMVDNYISLFDRLLIRREEILSKRQVSRFAGILNRIVN